MGGGGEARWKKPKLKGVEERGGGKGLNGKKERGGKEEKRKEEKDQKNGREKPQKKKTYI